MDHFYKQLNYLSDLSWSTWSQKSEPNHFFYLKSTSLAHEETMQRVLKLTEESIKFTVHNMCSAMEG